MAIQLFAGFRYHPDGVWMKTERTQPGRMNATKPARAPDQASVPPPSGDIAMIAGLSETDLTQKAH